MARPKKEIDFKIVKNLCGIQCTGEEIAGTLEIDYDTLSRRIKSDYGMSFAEYYKKNSAVGKISLRRLQWKAANGGNISMLIWLGKQYLDQVDKIESKLKVKKSYSKYEKMTNEEIIEEFKKELNGYIADKQRSENKQSRMDREDK